MNGGLLSHVSEEMRQAIREEQAEDSTTSEGSTTSESGLATSPFGDTGGEDSNHGDVSGGTGDVAGIDPRLALAGVAVALLAWRGL